eukprot:14368135-Heterocapsa_arctica.AAC.1
MDNVGLKELFEKLGAISPAVALRTTRTSARDSTTSVLNRRMDKAMKTQLKVIKSKPLYVGLDEKHEQRQERLRQCFQPDAGKNGMDQG